ncbi:HAMP domain-containing sensor histidine kinase [Paenibacillus sp. GSMTC-2017]|uniref:HAMP domain-containing sensor histidine kinase n=1 Tax=Paenibacillus sp. GSMTC-2017 TaxID=2794350 RepID=UPI001E28B899|nr:HAMP domain-containing sensor histidine kinase [Paenibacillus sp. GSMTC-2017]
MITVVFILGGLSSFFVIHTKLDRDVDMVALNELMKHLESNWATFEKDDYSTIERWNNEELNQPFIIIDNSGALLFQSQDTQLSSVHDAIKNRHTVVDIIVNGTLKGKLMIQTDDAKVMEQIKQRLILIVSSTFAMITLLCVFYIIYLNNTVFKPFRKLEVFAHHVAKGNFDIPLIMDDNNPFGAFTESFDLMREELAAARKREYEANRSKKELVATLSHDIKTPVASIKAVSELMLVKAEEDKIIKQLSTIYTKAEQINLLMTDMFLSTLEELTELKITVTEELSSVLQSMIENVNYDDQITCQPIPSCLLLTDVTRLQQVFDNILSNAYKYGGNSVSISSVINETHLEIYIMDYGKGIHPDELPLIFNKYYRGNNIGNKSGSGLGLYISKTLMVSMQGDIDGFNRADGFTVRLKIKLA